MQTEDLIFYHGTGRDAANAICKFGARDTHLRDIGAFDLGREILNALRRHAGASPDDSLRLFSVFGTLPGMEHSALWLNAFRALDGRGDSHFEYGRFFATLNIGNAYRYAISPYRSEFLLAIVESMRLLKSLADPLAITFADKYPEIAHAIATPSPPAVLELRGITAERLLTEKGSHDIQGELDLWSDMQRYPGLSAPVAFQIQNVAPNEIVAIHDLSDLTREDIGDGGWRPDDALITRVRRSRIIGTKFSKALPATD